MPANASRWIVLGSIVLILLVAVGYWLQRPAYGEIGRKGYDYAMALSSACSGRSQARVAKISQMITQSEEAGELNAAESNWLQQIVQQTNTGNWETAYENVRLLMQCQTERANPLPVID